MNESVLIVDDEEAIRRITARVLTDAGYQCDVASDAAEARAKLAADSFDLVVTDMNMPGESGLDLISDILQNDQDVAAIMVTGEDDARLADEALRLGAYGYLIKPVSVNQVVIAVNNALIRRELAIDNRMHRERLAQMVKDRTSELWQAIQRLERTQAELRRSRGQTVERLSIAAEFRDDETARHIQRMSRYCALLAKRLEWDLERSDLLRVASVMHDVGKIGVPDNILLKPGPLTPEEFEIMKQHTIMGFRILAGTGSELLELAAKIALSHHERLDGVGYPEGLTGDRISIEGKIAAVADVFDALTSDRVYRSAYPLGTAIEIMKEGRGTQFDSTLLDLFLDSMDEVLEIKEQESAEAAAR